MADVKIEMSVVELKALRLELQKMFPTRNDFQLFSINNPKLHELFSQLLGIQNDLKNEPKKNIT